MRRIAIGTFGTTLLLSLTLSAQSRPDLSGAWLLDSSAGSRGQSSGGGGAAVGGAIAGSGAGGSMGAASGGGARMGGAGGRISPMHITQTATSLTIERAVGSNTQTYVFTFDGKENVNVNGRITSKTRSHWDGSRLVTEGTQTFSSDTGDLTMIVREVRSLASDGTLVVESERTAEGNKTSSRQIYKKK